MILMGNYRNVPNGEIPILIDNIVNLSSPIMGFNRVEIMPPFELKFTFDNQFDMGYYDFIMQNDGPFFEFFSKIINQEYMNNNVYIIVSEGEGYDYINEALVKMIQVRYGVIVRYINEREDYYELVDDTERSFNILGIPNLDADLEKFRNIVSRINPGLLDTMVEE